MKCDYDDSGFSNVVKHDNREGMGALCWCVVCFVGAIAIVVWLMAKYWSGAPSGF